MIERPQPERILVTGASGLVGGGVLRRILEMSTPTTRLIALVRRKDWVPPVAPSRHQGFVIPLVGDITLPRFGLSAADWDALRESVTGVLHCAATTRFSTPDDEATLVNVGGTANVLDLARQAPNLTRFGHVSTAYVAGRRIGLVRESELHHTAGFVNAYERSKYQAEALVRRSGLPWSIYRVGAILGCETGEVHQMNGIYCVLRAFYDGLAPSLPGYDASPVDLVSEEFVVGALAHLFDRISPGETFHLCTGLEGCVTTRRFFEIATECFTAANPSWSQRGIPLPEMVGESAYRAFQRRAVEEGERDLARAAQRFQQFVPQLLHPKGFDHTNADVALAIARMAPIPTADLLAAVAARHAERAAEREPVRRSIWPVARRIGGGYGRAIAV